MQICTIILFQRLLYSYSQGDAKVVLVAESPDQVTGGESGIEMTLTNKQKNMIWFVCFLNSQTLASFTLTITRYTGLTYYTSILPQILYLMENIAEEVGWEPVKAAQQIAWAYLQTSGTLAQVSRPAISRIFHRLEHIPFILRRPTLAIYAGIGWLPCIFWKPSMSQQATPKVAPEGPSRRWLATTAYVH